MIDWEKIRHKFPACTKYVYLNSAGGAPISKNAADAGKKFYDELYLDGDFYYEDWIMRAENVRRKVAELVNARPAEIGFTSNSSQAMNHIAQILNSRGEVLTMRDEFPTSTIPWINQGVKVHFVEPEQHEYPIQRIKKFLKPEIKILVSSFIQYKTGFRQDLKLLGEFCITNKLVFVVNATQGFGTFDINVKEAGIDFMVFSGLKWAAAGYGAGGIYIANKWLDKIKLPVAGWQSVFDPDLMNNDEFIIRREASALEGGCLSFAPVFALEGALDLILKIGVHNIQKRILDLSKYLFECLKSLDIPVISFNFSEHSSGIVLVKTKNAEMIVKKLAEEGILVSKRGEGVRISLNFYNNISDVDILIKGLKKLISDI